MDTRSRGNTGEDQVAHYIASLGWAIIGRNVHFRFGEIDILAETNEAIIIVEVKIKTSTRQGFAVEMITPRKRQTLLRLAKLLESRYNKPIRVDVITIDNFGQVAADLQHYRSAVEN